MMEMSPISNSKDLDMIRSMEYFPCVMGLDLNMVYYHVKLDTDAPKLYNIVFPWGKYKYKCSPMGIKIASDIFSTEI
jgi:hypothetical protein